MNIQQSPNSGNRGGGNVVMLTEMALFAKMTRRCLELNPFHLDCFNDRAIATRLCIVSSPACRFLRTAEH
jgi:hypothetical protein